MNTHDQADRAITEIAKMIRDDTLEKHKHKRITRDVLDSVANDMKQNIKAYGMIDVSVECEPGEDHSEIHASISFTLSPSTKTIFANNPANIPEIT